MRRSSKNRYKAIAIMAQEDKFLEKFENWQRGIKGLTDEEYNNLIVSMPFSKLVALTEQFCRTTRRV